MSSNRIDIFLTALWVLSTHWLAALVVAPYIILCALWWAFPDELLRNIPLVLGVSVVAVVIAVVFWPFRFARPLFNPWGRAAFPPLSAQIVALSLVMALLAFPLAVAWVLTSTALRQAEAVLETSPVPAKLRIQPYIVAELAATRLAQYGQVADIGVANNLDNCIFLMDLTSGEWRSKAGNPDSDEFIEQAAIHFYALHRQRSCRMPRWEYAVGPLAIKRGLTPEVFDKLLGENAPQLLFRYPAAGDVRSYSIDMNGVAEFIRPAALALGTALAPGPQLSRRLEEYDRHLVALHSIGGAFESARGGIEELVRQAERNQSERSLGNVLEAYRGMQALIEAAIKLDEADSFGNAESSSDRRERARLIAELPLRSIRLNQKKLELFKNDRYHLALLRAFADDTTLPTEAWDARFRLLLGDSFLRTAIETSLRSGAYLLAGKQDLDEWERKFVHQHATALRFAVCGSATADARPDGRFSAAMSVPGRLSDQEISQIVRDAGINPSALCKSSPSSMLPTTTDGLHQDTLKDAQTNAEVYLFLSGGLYPIDYEYETSRETNTGGKSEPVRIDRNQPWGIFAAWGRDNAAWLPRTIISLWAQLRPWSSIFPWLTLLLLIPLLLAIRALPNQTTFWGALLGGLYFPMIAVIAVFVFSSASANVTILYWFFVALFAAFILRLLYVLALGPWLRLVQRSRRTHTDIESWSWHYLSMATFSLGALSTSWAVLYVPLIVDSLGLLHSRTYDDWPTAADLLVPFCLWLWWLIGPFVALCLDNLWREFARANNAAPR